MPGRSNNEGSLGSTAAGRGHVRVRTRPPSRGSRGLGTRTLAHRTDGAQRLPLVDYLLAAAAQHTASAVLHYDHDFDTLAEIMGFDSQWLAPPGSMD